MDPSLEELEALILMGLKELSPRKREMVDLVSKGHTSKVIAEIMRIQTASVESTFTQILCELGLPPSPDWNNRVLVARVWILNSGLI